MQRRFMIVSFLGLALNKLPQMQRLKTKEFILSQFWNFYIQSKSVCRVGSFYSLLQKILCLSPGIGWLLAVLAFLDLQLLQSSLLHLHMLLPLSLIINQTLGLRLILLQYNLSLTNHFHKDPISKQGHSLKLQDGNITELTAMIIKEPSMTYLQLNYVDN